jgi:hypothetical protein
MKGMIIDGQVHPRFRAEGADHLANFLQKIPEVYPAPLLESAKDLWSFAVTSMRALMSSSNTQTCPAVKVLPLLEIALRWRRMTPLRLARLFAIRFRVAAYIDLHSQACRMRILGGVRQELGGDKPYMKGMTRVDGAIARIIDGQVHPRFRAEGADHLANFLQKIPEVYPAPLLESAKDLWSFAVTSMRALMSSSAGGE